MANTFRNNPVWDEMLQKDIKCSAKSRTKIDPDWVYAVGTVYCSIVKKGDKYGVVARADKEDKYTGVCACKYDMVQLMYMIDEYQECSYAYFAVLKNGKYGVFRVETSNEISDCIYGKEVVPCIYDQVAPINTTLSMLNIILLMNNRIEINEYNNEISRIDTSYYNGYTGRISDTYSGIITFRNCISCYKPNNIGYVINLYDDSIIYKSTDYYDCIMVGKTEKWKVFMERCSGWDNRKRLIFYNVFDKDTFIMDGLKRVCTFSNDDETEVIITHKGKKKIEIIMEDESIMNAVNNFSEGPKRFYYRKNEFK